MRILQARLSQWLLPRRLAVAQWAPYAFRGGGVDAGGPWLALQCLPPLFYLPVLGVAAVEHVQQQSITNINPEVLARVSDHETEVKRIRKRVLLQFRSLALELIRSAGPALPRDDRLPTTISRMIFDVIDKSADDDISLAEFHAALNNLEIFLSVPACKWFYSSLDRFGTGGVTFEDFECCMREEIFDKLDLQEMDDSTAPLLVRDAATGGLRSSVTGLDV